MWEVGLFVAGKIVVFSLLGLLFWLFGESFEASLIDFFPIFRKVIGPLIILTGLVLIGILKLKFLNKWTIHLSPRVRNGKFGSFLLGVSFSLAFCPTMFLLFFSWLMPIVMSTSYGFVLPAIFGLATPIPLIVLFLLIWIFDAKGIIMKRSRKVGHLVQYLAGALLIFIGIIDTMTYWAI